jgi:ABC-type oligopeptide transport system substrate-binding subunit
MNSASLRRLAGLACLFSCCVLVATGCAKEPKSGAAENNLKVLNRGNGGEPGTLDPALATDIHAFNILVDLYEGLTAEAADGRLIPGVAESWEISEDGLSYSFKLRGNARWSDGSRVVASDFVDPLRRVVAPSTASSYSFLLQPLTNFDDIQTGNLPTDTLGVFAESDSELVMTLSRPIAHWLSILAMPVTFPMKSATDGAQLTNGPYELLSRKFDGITRLKKSEHYWSSESVSIEQVSYHAVVDPIAEFNMYRTGELDITHVIPSEHVAALREERPDEIRISPSLAFYYLAFDLTEPLLGDSSLRAALSLAIDRQVIVKVVGRGEQPAFGVVPPGIDGYQSASYDWRNLAPAERISLAQKHYADAGFGPDNPLQIKVTYDIGDIHEKVALAVASMWRDVLGVDVALEKLEWKLLLDTRDQRDRWQVMRFSWFGDYKSAETFLDIFQSDSLQNLPQYQDAQFDELLTAARNETDWNRNSALLRAAEQHLLNDYPVAPLYFFVSKHLVRPGVSGFEDNILDRHPTRFMDISM